MAIVITTYDQPHANCVLLPSSSVSAVAPCQCEQNAFKKPVSEVNGYIHKISDIMVGRSGVRYSDFKVQQSQSKFTGVACFSPEERDIKKGETSKSPVRLLNLSPKKKDANQMSKSIP